MINSFAEAIHGIDIRSKSFQKLINSIFIIVITSVLLSNQNAFAANTAACIQANQGGTENCEEATPILSPWEFRACSETRPTVREWSSWCQANGGVWTGGTSNGACSVTGGFYSSDSQMEGASSAFSGIYTNACAGPALASDSGWGSVQSYSCWSVNHTFINGIEVSSGKKLVYTGSTLDNDGSCSQPWTMPIVGWKKRDYKCPQNTTSYTGGTAPNTTLTCVYAPAYSLTPSISNDCQIDSDKEGNPCNPATGNKSQIENDYASGGSSDLNISRFYNSLPFDSDKHFAENWSHTYSSKMDAYNKIAPFKAYYTRAFKSDPHGTREAACLIGFSEIKNTVWGGSLSEATPQYTGGNLCKISINGSTVTWFNINSESNLDPEPLPANIHTIIRPNGRRYVFEEVNGTWVSSIDPNVKLESDGSNWVFTNSNSSKETYNSTGKLIIITSLSGRTVTLNYDISIADGGDDDATTLDQVIDGTGRSLLFSYTNEAGKQRISTITTPDGDIQYEYSDKGNLIKTIYPNNDSKTYHYEDNRSPSHLTGITDEKNVRYATWTYNGVGKVISSEHANGTEKVTFGYNLYYQNNTTVGGALLDRRTYKFTVERGARRVKEITGDQCRTCGNGFMKTRTYDANGFLNGYTDWNGNQTAIVNNNRGLPISHTEAVGTAQERTTTTIWHNSLNLPVTITEPKRKTEFTYTATGQLLTNTLTDLATNESHTTTYTYHPAGSNGAGLIATVDGARTDVNDVTSYGYDAQDNLTTITNALGHTTSITAHDPSGRPLSITDANGTVTTLEWDARGRLSLYTQDGRTTAFGYDPVGQLTRVTFPDYSYIEYTYDEAHRLTEISDKANNRIIYTLDKMGNRTNTTTEDSTGAIALNQSAVFDKLSHLQQSLGANGQQQTYSYDDNHNPLSSTDVISRQTQSNYDALDRLLKSIDPDAKETNFEYDAQDNLTKVTDARNLETTYTYNGFDEVISQTSPDTGTTTYTYDKAGNRISMTDARGIIVNYSFDALNRLTQVDYADNTLDITHQYDAGTHGKGRLTQILDASGQTDYNYDARGNLLTQVVTQNGNSHTTRYTYNNANRLSGMTYPSGNTLQYQRASNGDITQITATIDGVTKTLLSNASYRPFGPLKQFTYGNGLSHTANFDTSGRLTGQSTANIQGNTYSYNTVDNLISFNNTLDSTLNQQFTYNTLDRLSNAQGDYGNFQYVFGVVGNRTQKVDDSQTHNYNYASNSHHLQSVSGGQTTNYQYDANGNTTDNGTFQFSYGEDNRLHQVTQASTTVADYTYNAQGQRTRKTTPTGTSYYHYNQQGNLIAETNEQGNSQRETVWFNGSPYALLIKDGQNNPPPTTAGIPYITTPAAGTTLTGNSQTFSWNANGAAVDFYWIDISTVLDNGNIFSDDMGLATSKTVNNLPTDGSTVYVRLSYNNNWDYVDYQYSTNIIPAAGTPYLSSPTPATTLTGASQTFNWEANGTAIDFYWLDIGSTLGSYDIYSQELSASTTSQLVNNLPTDGSTLYVRLFYNDNWDYVDYQYTAASGAGETTAVYYFHNNHLGAPETLTDKDQSIVWQASHTPYGDATITMETITNNIRLPGQYFDSETGLHYNYFRYYDAKLGRYVTSDPIGLAGGINTYGYVSGNPVNKVDPLGLVESCTPGLFGWALCHNPDRPPMTPGAPSVPPAPIIPVPPIPAVPSIPNTGDTGAQMCPSNSSDNIEECERQCDLEWDRNKVMCDVDALKGYDSNRYRQCMKIVDEIYIECIANCN